MVKASKMKRGVIILAAGQGKRMRSALPKVLHDVAGAPLMHSVFRALKSVAIEHGAPLEVAVVIGHQAGAVQEAAERFDHGNHLKFSFIEQKEQLGTGHAARMAMDSAWGEARRKEDALVLVLPGDSPMIPPELVRSMLEPLDRSDVIRLLTCEIDNPYGYGRVVRKKKDGPVLRIVEEKDAKPREREIREVATSIYSFQAKFLASSLARLSDRNAQREYYLTDTIALAAQAKKRIDVLVWGNSEDVRGVNDPWELSIARGLINRRILESWARKGVQLIDPNSTWIDATVELAPEVVLDPGVILRGNTQIDACAVIGAHSVIKDSKISENVMIRPGCVIEGARLGAGATVGPMAHLRAETVVGEQCRVGNFVELKKTTLDSHTSVAHLSYLGDANVGRNVNIGCGFVTCNFDGRIIDGKRKHETVIEDDVFVGSDCQAVAPVRLGKGAFIASGSTITEDVPPGSLALARSRQVNKPGYASKYRKGDQTP